MKRILVLAVLCFTLTAFAADTATLSPERNTAPRQKERMMEGMRREGGKEGMKEQMKANRKERREVALEKINKQLERMDQMEKRMVERKTKLMAARDTIMKAPAGSEVEMPAFTGNTPGPRTDKKPGQRPVSKEMPMPKEDMNDSER